MQEKTIIKYDLTSSYDCSQVSDWPVIMIGPSGLLLVVSAVPVLVLWVGLEKSKLQNLDVRNISPRSH